MKPESDSLLHSNATEPGFLIFGMRAACARGENGMEFARILKISISNSAELSAVLKRTGNLPENVFGFDISWARCFRVQKIVVCQIFSSVMAFWSMTEAQIPSLLE